MKITVELPDPTPAPEAGSNPVSNPKKTATPAPSQPKQTPSADRAASGMPEAKAAPPAPKSKAEPEGAPATLKKQPPPSAPESAPEVRPPAGSRPVAKTPPKASEEKPSQPSALSTNPLHSFD